MGKAKSCTGCAIGGCAVIGLVVVVAAALIAFNLDWIRDTAVPAAKKGQQTISDMWTLRSDLQAEFNTQSISVNRRHTDAGSRLVLEFSEPPFVLDDAMARSIALFTHQRYSDDALTAIEVVLVDKVMTGFTNRHTYEFSIEELDAMGQGVETPAVASESASGSAAAVAVDSAADSATKDKPE